ESVQEARASQSPEQLVEQLRNNWQQLRASVSKRNKIAGIMLTEARVLGLRDDTVVLGHTTGALAERLNAPANNKDIVAVVSEEAGYQLAVNCIVGTHTEAAGSSVQKPKPLTWNPRAAQTPQAATRETGDDDDQESESPRDYNNSAPSQPADKSVENQDRNAPPAQEPSGWGAPRALGGEGAAQQPSPTPPATAQPTSAPQDGAPNRTAPNQAQAQSETPAQAPAQAQPAQDDWRARIAQAKAQTQQREEELRNSGTFSDGRPLPPDPGPDSYPEYESVPPEDAYPP